MSKSDRAKPPATGPKVEPKVPSRRAVGTAKALAKPAAKKADKRGTPKNKGTVKRPNGSRIGNPPFVATEEQRGDVVSLVAAGAQHWIVARALQIDKRTLERHFKVELEHGKQLADAKIGGSITRKALNGDSDMEKFYAARRMGWKTGTELTGANGGPIEYRNLSDEELDARIAALSGNATATAEN